MKKDFEVTYNTKEILSSDKPKRTIVIDNNISDKTKKKLLNIAEESSSIASALTNNPDTMYKQNLLHSLNDLSLEMKKIVNAELKDLPENHILVDFKKPLIKMERVADIIHFSFNENIPHQITFDKSMKKERYVFDTQEYYTWCYESTMEFFKKNGPYYYKERCGVLFISYYDEETFPIDHDNLEVKYFIDGALKPFLRGDNAFDLSLLFHAEKDEHCHTEVYFGPILDISLFLTKQIENSRTIL